MHVTTVILVGGDQGLANLVRPVVAGTSSCRFEHVPLPADALVRLEKGGVGIALVYLDGGTSEGNAIKFLQTAHQFSPAMPTLALSERLDAEKTLGLLRMGAVDCLDRPFNISRLGLLVDILTVRTRHSQPAVVPAPQRNGDRTEVRDLNGFLVASQPGRRLVEHLCQIAPLDSTILLTGETGTGKTSLARLVHHVSPRRERPFLVINCGALSPTLIESELFGHKRGAFTGADQDRIGKLEQVRDGTLLLDEIDSFPSVLQGKLLRAVEDRVFEPVGSNESRPLRARLIAASNRVLEDEVAAGRFRADLFFRLNVISFSVLPLRDRREAIPHFAGKFLAEFALQNGQPAKNLSADAMAALITHPWPGNVRELRNVIERSVALCSGAVVEVTDLPDAIQARAAGESDEPKGIQSAPANGLAQARLQAERDRLQEALRRHKNNRSHAALDLGISRVTLYKKLHKYRLV